MSKNLGNIPETLYAKHKETAEMVLKANAEMFKTYFEFEVADREHTRASLNGHPFDHIDVEKTWGDAIVSKRLAYKHVDQAHEAYARVFDEATEHFKKHQGQYYEQAKIEMEEYFAKKASRLAEIDRATAI